MHFHSSLFGINNSYIKWSRKITAAKKIIKLQNEFLEASVKQDYEVQSQNPAEEALGYTRLNPDATAWRTVTAWHHLWALLIFSWQCMALLTSSSVNFWRLLEGYFTRWSVLLIMQTSNGRVIDKWWTWKAMKGSLDLNRRIIRHFLGRAEENGETPLYGFLVPRQRFEPRTSRIRTESVTVMLNHSVTSEENS